MRSAEFYQCVLGSRLTSIAVLSLLGLLAAPSDCPLHGVDAFELHDPGDKKGHCYWACSVRVKAIPKKKLQKAAERGIPVPEEDMVCFAAETEKVRWYTCCPLAQKHRQMHAPQLLEMIWHFGRETPSQEAAYDLQLSRDTVQDSFHKIRLDLECFMYSLTGGKLGGGDRVVVVDVTYRSKKRKQAAGFVGAYHIGHLTAIIGMIELLGKGVQRRTGKVRLLLVEGENRPTIEAVFREHVQEGCEVWSDGGSAFLWLDAPGSGYKHESVIHKNREFSKFLPPDAEGEEAKLVSTNAAEGLFGRVKRWFARRDVKGLTREAYGPWLAEWLWRHQFLGPDALGAEREPYRQQFWQTVRFLVSQNKPSLSEFSDVPWDAEKAFTDVAKYLEFVRARDKQAVERRAHVLKSKAAQPLEDQSADVEPEMRMEEEGGGRRFGRLNGVGQPAPPLDLDFSDQESDDVQSEEADAQFCGEWLDGIGGLMPSPPGGLTPTGSVVGEQEPEQEQELEQEQEVEQEQEQEEQELEHQEPEEAAPVRPQDRLLGEGWSTRMEVFPSRTRQRQPPLATVIGVPLRRKKKPRREEEEEEAVPVRRSQRLEDARAAVLAAPILD